MFDRLIESTNERRLARTWLFFAASTVTWSVVLAGVAVAGVFLADAKLDADFERLSLVPISHPSPAPPRRNTQPERPRETAPQSTFVAIVRPHETIAPPPPTSPYTGPIAPIGNETGAPDGRIDGTPDGINPDGPPTGGPGPVVPVPAPPQPATDTATDTRPPAPSRPKHIGVINGLAMRRVEPMYPQMAISTGVQGTVVVSVTVSETGRVLEAHAVSGHPLLRQASVDAARRWQFSPTILNGIPIKVIGTINFNFRKS